jgi:hypothetical protein
LIQHWTPTHLVVPALNDLHPDHSAAAAVVVLALRVLRMSGAQGSDRAKLWSEGGVYVLPYLVHGPVWAVEAGARALCLDSATFAAKRGALMQHATQMMLSRRRMLGYARRVETFALTAPALARHAHHPVRRIWVDGAQVVIHVATAPRWHAWGAARLHLLALRDDGSYVSLKIGLPGRNGSASVIDAVHNEAVSQAEVRGTRRHAVVRLPVSCLSGAGELLGKVERQIGLYDEAGWRRLAVPPEPARQSPSAAPLMNDSSGDTLVNVETNLP